MMLNSIISGVKRPIVSWVRTKPWIYVPVRCAWAKDADGVSRALNSRTQIVIDAYPRSANSFATVAFQCCQTKPTFVAHHYHAAATIIYGAQHSIPSLTFVRHPDDACLSNALFQRTKQLRRVFQEYVNFYKPILPYRSKIVVAKFETVVKNYGVVIATVNDVYKTDFTLFDHTAENVSRVESILVSRTTRRFGAEAFSKGHGETPTQEKDKLKEELTPLLNEKSLQEVRQQAITLYRQFSDGADI
jgi:hypothetical protein